MAYKGKNFQPGYNSNNRIIRHTARAAAKRKRILSGGGSSSSLSNNKNGIIVSDHLKPKKKETDVGDVILGIIRFLS